MTTKNFVEMILNKDFKAFNDNVQESLDAKRDEAFLNFSGEFVNEGAHEDMVNQHMDAIDVVDSPELFGADVSDEDVVEFHDEDIEALLADLDIEEQIEMLLDAEAITEDDLADLTAEKLEELSKATLKSYAKKASKDVTAKFNAADAHHSKADRLLAKPSVSNLEKENKIRWDARNNRTAGFDKADAALKRQKNVEKAKSKANEEVEAPEEFDRKTFAESIVAKYTKKTASDSTGTAVIAGSLKAPAEETDPSKKAKVVRDKKNPGRVEGGEINPFKEEVEADEYDLMEAAEGAEHPKAALKRISGKNLGPDDHMDLASHLRSYANVPKKRHEQFAHKFLEAHHSVKKIDPPTHEQKADFHSVVQKHLAASSK